MRKTLWFNLFSTFFQIWSWIYHCINFAVAHVSYWWCDCIIYRFVFICRVGAKSRVHIDRINFTNMSQKCNTAISFWNRDKWIFSNLKANKYFCPLAKQIKKKTIVILFTAIQISNYSPTNRTQRSKRKINTEIKYFMGCLSLCLDQFSQCFE